MTPPEEPAGRAHAAECVTAALAPLDGVRSVRLVGSYWSSEVPQAPADVDVVVILDHLTRDRFERCVQAAQRLTGADFGVPGAPVRVNDTFGPMKIGARDDVVVHLMVYDVAGHRAHVLDSPFTCLDWEREDRGHGPSLRETYAVPPIAPTALLAARRGVADYVNDLAAGVVSVRRYQWDSDGAVRTVVDRVALDTRNRGEFALHVVRHLLTNYSKVVTGRNETLAEPALRATWDALLPAQRALQDEYFAALEQKRAGAVEFAVRAVAAARAFAESFGAAVDAKFGAVRRARVVRHAQSTVRDLSFLGQRRDPSLADAASVAPLDRAFADVWTSSASRARETAARLAPGVPARADDRLREIDYGDAEGLDIAAFRVRYPEIVAAWARGEGPNFPGGESPADVLARLEDVLEELARGRGEALVVTHNVVMRCLIGSRLGVPPHRWHEIVVPYLGGLEVWFLDGRAVVELEREWLGAVLDRRSAP